MATKPQTQRSRGLSQGGGLGAAAPKKKLPDIALGAMSATVGLLTALGLKCSGDSRNCVPLQLMTGIVICWPTWILFGSAILLAAAMLE